MFFLPSFGCQIEPLNNIPNTFKRFGVGGVFGGFLQYAFLIISDNFRIFENLFRINFKSKRKNMNGSLLDLII